MLSPRSISALFLLLLFCVSSFLYYPRYLAESGRRSQLAATLSGADEPLALNARTKSADCVTRGALPDPTCTTGSVFPDAVPEKICVPGYTKTVRSVPTKLRKAVFAEYGISYPQPTGAYEVDHFIPLALGGNNEIANLFPEAAEPAPGFHEKDIVEVYLYEEVCAGRVVLSVAQQAIADDWLSIYTNMSPDDIKRLKSKYRSWSN